MIRRVVLLASLAALAACSKAASQAEASEMRQVQSIVRNTASPFCPGQTLDSCPSPRAGEWRRDIHSWVADGVPEAQIRRRLQARVPGFDLTIPAVKWGWAIPMAAVLLSTAWLLFMTHRLTRRSDRGPRGTGGHHPEHPLGERTLDAKLDQELTMLD